MKRRIEAPRKQAADMVAAQAQLIIHRVRNCRAWVMIHSGRQSSVKGCGDPAVGENVYRDDIGRIAKIPMCETHIAAENLNIIQSRSDK